jgi:DNA-cytosine methyltransferase
MGLEKKLNVLSLFDGMSGTQMALYNSGIAVDKYYASEIDKYAIKITQKNFPDTIQLGDVKDIKGKDLPEIDLVVAGSPCQGFSFAGKQLAFDDPRSALFFEFIRILREVKPKYFLLENVRMKKEFQDVISEQISSVYPEYTSGGLFSIEPILINSALVSAQNRQRLYWTNIPNIEQPEDLGIVLRDVLEDSFVADRDKSYCIDANYYKGGNPKNYFEKSRRQLVFDKEFDKMTTKDGKSYALTATYQGAVAWNSIEKKQRTMIPTYDTPKQVGVAADLKGYDIIKRVYSENGKSPTLTTMGGGHREPKVAVTSYREVRTKEAKEERKRIRKETGKDHTPFRAKELVPREDGKVGTLTPSLNKDHTISVKSMTEVRTPEANKIRREHKKKTGKDWSPRHMRHLVERKDDKSNTITANTSKQHTIQIEQEEELTWRKLTPLECERLQTFPDNYTEGVSNTQRYKMLGNGFTVRVIEHILKNMEI